MIDETLPAYRSWLGLEGRVCVITGGAGGIGSAIARELAAVGALVALLDRDDAGLARAAAAIERAGGRAMTVSADITQPDSIEDAAAKVADTFGPCTVLVNNAAAIYADALMNVRLDRWNHVMSVNLTGPIICSKVFGRMMVKAGGGSLIHVGSSSGSYPQAFSGAYSVSKAGLKMLSGLLTVELGEHRIRSNVVSPSMVLTPMSEGIYRDPEVLRRREAIVPAGRIGLPGDIAEAVLFLASERSSYVNGQQILVDGGLSSALSTLIPRPGFEKADTAGAART